MKILYLKKPDKEVLDMNLTRAKQIASSPEKAEVRYNGKPVIIEKINEDNGIAHIRFLDNPEKKDQVSITNLEEK